MSDITGHCLCGAVTFSVDAVNPEHHACHCDMCRRWSGAPFFAATVENIRFAGEDNITRYPSSRWAERGFCTTCGTNLFYRFKEADEYYVCVGAFDDQTPFKMVGEIYIDSKPPGYAFAGDHPRLTEAEFLEKIGIAD